MNFILFVNRYLINLTYEKGIEALYSVKGRSKKKGRTSEETERGGEEERESLSPVSPRSACRLSPTGGHYYCNFRIRRFSLFGGAKIGASATPKSEKCLAQAEKPTETLATQAIMWAPLWLSLQKTHSFLPIFFNARKALPRSYT